MSRSRTAREARLLALPVDVNDADRFPNIARASREFRTKPEAERARLNEGWPAEWRA